jgi:hypothetical protein
MYWPLYTFVVFSPQTHWADFSKKLPGENSAKNYPPKNVEKNGIFCGKCFEKFVFPTNSTEFSAESEFPRKKMYEKMAPQVTLFI